MYTKNNIMKFRFIIIIYFIPRLLIAQINDDFQISAKGMKQDVVLLDIKNKTSQKKTFYIDTEALHFACIKGQVWMNTFIRPNICVQLPSNVFTDESIGVCQDCKGGYGFYGNTTLQDYLRQYKIVLNPYEKKSFLYNLQDTSKKNKKFKILSVKARIIFTRFQYNGRFSNTQKFTYI